MGQGWVRLAEVTGVILAGGRSQRMGTDKALLPVDGELLVERAARALAPFAHRLLVLDRPGEGPLRAGQVLPHWVRVYDRFPGTGPLGGLITALAAAPTPWVALAACDMPHLSPAYYEALVAQLRPGCQVLVPRWAEGAEPLAGAYHREALPVLLDALERGERKLVRAVEPLVACPVEPGWLEPHQPHRLFANVNRPEEYQTLTGVSLRAGAVTQGGDEDEQAVDPGPPRGERRGA